MTIVGDKNLSASLSGTCKREEIFHGGSTCPLRIRASFYNNQFHVFEIFVKKQLIGFNFFWRKMIKRIAQF
jgi:hypothetical protein